MNKGFLNLITGTVLVLFLTACVTSTTNNVSNTKLTEIPVESPSPTDSSSEKNSMNEIAYTTPAGETGYVYVPDTVLNEPNIKVPMVLMMCATGSEARHDAEATGWVEKALEENLIVLAPNYNNYATYSQVDAIISAVDYIIKNYPVDTTRVYSTGFSNGGATSVALVSKYPQYFAAISALGWMVDLNYSKDVYAAYDIPFQVIQGTEEYTQQTTSGAMSIMDDEQHAIRSLFLFNEMIKETDAADYDTTPYWGYPPADSHTITPDGRKWTVNNYFKAGYTVPFAQLVLIDGASHRPNKKEADVTWDFFKNFFRSKDGIVIERANEQGAGAMSDEEQIVAAYQKMQDAVVNKDTDYLRSVMGDTVRHITGKTQTIDEWLSDVENERMKYYSIKIEKPVVVINGNTAKLTCTNVIDARIYGSRGIWRLSGSASFKKIDGSWIQIVPDTVGGF